MLSAGTLRQLPPSGSLVESSAGAGVSLGWLVSSGGPVGRPAGAALLRPPLWSLFVEPFGHLMTLEGRSKVTSAYKPGLPHICQCPIGPAGQSAVSCGRRRHSLNTHRYAAVGSRQSIASSSGTGRVTSI